LGYLGSNHYLVKDWTKTYPAHNCLTIRDEHGDPRGTVHLRGDLRRHFAVSPICQVVDTAEYDPEAWEDSGFGENGELSRQLILMSPSDDHQYVVDIARAKGGASHDLYLHSHGLGFKTEGIELTSVEDPDQNLYEYSGWSWSSGENWGAKNIHNLEAGESTGPWQATWSKIDDYRGQPAGEPRIAEDVFLRMWMLDEPGSEVIAGDGPAQRHFHNEDIGREMKIVTVRRENSETVNNFVSVIEPYRDEPFIKNVRRIPVDTDDEYTVAIVVEHQLGEDYIICYGGPGEPKRVHVADSGHKINTDGDVAVFSFPPQGEPTLFLAGGNSLGSNEGKLSILGPAQVTGTLLDFDDTADTLLIQPDDAAGWKYITGEAVAGQPVVVQHTEDRTTYTIASVEILEDRNVQLHLDDAPHLMQNYLFVREVDDRGIVVEPPPVLDHKRRTFKVYGGDEMRLLGPLRDIDNVVIRDEFGTEMHRLHRIVTDDYSGVQAGQEIAITRLEKGRDTVTINRYAYSLTQRTRTPRQLSLPKVLLIGDSISMGYSEPVKRLLKDGADVRRIPMNGGPTPRGLANLDKWLGDEDWDIIHFNFGLHDTWYRNGKNRSVSPDEYEENLREIVTRLQETGAKLIWANTTPVPEKVEPGWYSKDIVLYNKIARQVMEENGVAINDMYSRALECLDEIQPPDNIHFTEHGYRVMAEWIAESIGSVIDGLPDD
ncbi:MAG: SGNH/GDSL hydrolase family protein, partial [Armatimonadota bacterium]